MAFFLNGYGHTISCGFLCKGPHGESEVGQKQHQVWTRLDSHAQEWHFHRFEAPYLDTRCGVVLDVGVSNAERQLTTYNNLEELTPTPRTSKRVRLEKATVTLRLSHVWVLESCYSFIFTFTFHCWWVWDHTKSNIQIITRYIKPQTINGRAGFNLFISKAFLGGLGIDAGHWRHRWRQRCSVVMGWCMLCCGQHGVTHEDENQCYLCL